MQTTLSKFRQPCQPMEIDLSEDDSYKSNDRRGKKLIKWSRVRSRAQLQVKHPRIYDIKDELEALKKSEKHFPRRLFVE